MEIKFITIRVKDLEKELLFYQKMTGTPPHYFVFNGMKLASIGSFLLFSGSDEQCKKIKDIKAVLSVANLDATVKKALEAGAKIIQNVESTPNGRRAVLQHPDQSIFEYSGE